MRTGYRSTPSTCERLGGVVGVTGPAEPHAAGVAQHRQQRPDQPAGARRPPVVGAHHRQPVGGDHDGGPAGRRRQRGRVAVRLCGVACGEVDGGRVDVVMAVGVSRWRQIWSSAGGEVGDEVGAVLDPDREAHEVVGHLERRAGGRRVGHRRRVLDEALDGTERFGEREDLGRGGDTHRGIPSRGEREGNHPAEVAHLLGRGGVAGMVGELRVEHPLDGAMAGQQVDDGAGVLAVAVHPHGQRLHAAQARGSSRTATGSRRPRSG